MQIGELISAPAAAQLPVLSAPVLRTIKGYSHYLGLVRNSARTVAFSLKARTFKKPYERAENEI